MSIVVASIGVACVAGCGRDKSGTEQDAVVDAAADVAACHGGGACGGGGQIGNSGGSGGGGAGGNGGNAGRAGGGGGSAGAIAGHPGGASGGVAGAGNGGLGGGGAGASASGGAGGASGTVSEQMTFFVTSRGMGNGGNLNGLAGADAFCQTLAAAVSSALGAKTWHAYLSTSTVNARDRIGNGPWRNARGRIVANDLAQLHDQGGGGQGGGGALDATWPANDPTVALDERGSMVPTYSMMPSMLRADVLTGSNPDGTASAFTCSDWTSTGTTMTSGQARGGRADRAAGTSWNSSFSTACDLIGALAPRGVFYCFAVP